MQTVTVGLLVAKGEKTNRKCDIGSDLRGGHYFSPFPCRIFHFIEFTG